MSLMVNTMMDESVKAERLRVGEFSHAGPYPNVS